MSILIYGYVAIRAKRDEIRAGVTDIRAEPLNLRGSTENDSAWWPSDVVTDGADHFRLSTITAGVNRPAAPGGGG